MHELARLSADERRRIVDDFLDEVLGDLDVDPELVARLRMARPDLPDDPSREQIEAWIELAQLIADPDFRGAIRAMSERGAAERASTPADTDRAAAEDAAQLVGERAGAALAAGIDPLSDAAAPVVDELAAAFAAAHQRDDGPAYRAWLADMLATFNDARVERYWQLLAIINGWPQRPPIVPAWEWFGAALRGG